MAKDYNNLKKWIEKMCKDAGLPIYKVANRAGVSRAIIYNWMIDRNRPDEDTLLRVAQVFADHTGRKSEEIFAEGLTQYTTRPKGRPRGSGGNPKPVVARS